MIKVGDSGVSDIDKLVEAISNQTKAMKEQTETITSLCGATATLLDMVAQDELEERDGEAYLDIRTLDGKS